MPQEPRQKTAKTQPFPIGDAVVPQCADNLSGYAKAGCIFEPFWETPVLIQPSGIGGTNWSPVPYNPDTATSMCRAPCAPAPSRATAISSSSGSATPAVARRP